MVSIPHGDRRQLALRSAFGLIWLLVLVFLLLHTRAQNGMVLSDWIIDYRQGFVRRGLVGAMLAPISDLTGLPVWQLAPAVILGLWTVFLYRFGQVLAGRDKPFWYVLLLLSPAGLIFSVYLIGDVGRKEVMHFALLAQFLCLLDRKRLSAGWTVALAVLAFAAGLSHEIVAFYAAYFLVAAHWSRQGRAAWLAAGAVVLACVLSVAVVGMFAQSFDGPAFCRSLAQEDGASSSLCKGTILWPLLTLSASLADTKVAVSYFDYPSLYAVALLLTFAPIVLWMRRYESSEFKRALMPITVVVLLTLPLFFVAVDWGRFIQIHVVSSAMVLALRLPRHAHVRLDAVEQPSPHVFTLGNRWIRGGVALASLAAALVWQMPLCCQGSMQYGLVGKVGTKLGWVASVAK